MYGSTILATLMSIVLIGIISPAAGMMMIATSVFGTLIFFRVQSFSHIPRVEDILTMISCRDEYRKRIFFRVTSLTEILCLLGESMISQVIPISHDDITRRVIRSKSLLEATEWTMMIAVWVKKGVFH